MIKHIWCEVCESPKGPLFKVEDDKGKHYICKRCLNKLKMIKADEKIARDAERKRNDCGDL